MANRSQFSEQDSRRLIVAITDFLRDQLNVREDLLPEDRDCLEIAIQCLEMAYGLDPNGYVQLRFSRPLLDIFSQVTNPIPVRDRLRADTHKDQGNEYMSRNMHREAEAEYTAAIELDRWNSIYHCNRAGARIEQQNYFDAIADCRQALMLNPDYAKAYGRMGQAYALLNRPREAARCFRHALQLDPRNDRYRNNLGVAESQINRTDVMGLFSGVLSSIFGTGTQTAPRVSSGTRTAPSFMIFAERPNPARDTPQRNPPPDQKDGETARTERNEPVNPFWQGLSIPTTFGETDSNSTRSSAVESDPSEDTDDGEEADIEIIVAVPEYSSFSDVVPVSCPCRTGYDFASRDARTGGINHATTGLGHRHLHTHHNEANVSLGTENSQPNAEKDAESTKHPSPENSENIATDTPKAQDADFEHISSGALDGSIGIKSSQPKKEEYVTNTDLSAPESSKTFETDESKAQDTDSKQIPSHTTDKQPFVVRWPTNDEWDKLKKDDGRNTAASPSDIKSPKAEKNVANNSGILKADAGTANETEESGQSEVQMPSNIKLIRSDSDLFETIQSLQGSNVSDTKEKSKNSDEKSKVTDENESRHKPDDAN